MSSKKSCYRCHEYKCRSSRGDALFFNVKDKEEAEGEDRVRDLKLGNENKGKLDFLQPCDVGVASPSSGRRIKIWTVKLGKLGH